MYKLPWRGCWPYLFPIFPLPNIYAEVIADSAKTELWKRIFKAKRSLELPICTYNSKSNNPKQYLEVVYVIGYLI